MVTRNQTQKFKFKSIFSKAASFLGQTWKLNTQLESHIYILYITRLICCFVIIIMIAGMNAQTYECSIEYTENIETLVELQLTQSHCNFNISFPTRERFYVFYELQLKVYDFDEFLNSYSPEQLQGEKVYDSALLSSCYPFIKNSTTEKIYSPCGAKARFVFNDTFQFFYNNSTPIIVDDMSSHYATMEPKQKSIINPVYNESDHSVFDIWLPRDIFPEGQETYRFILWMRNIVSSTIREFYGVLLVDHIEFPINVSIHNRYRIQNKNIVKKLIITNSNHNSNELTGFCMVFIAIFTTSLTLEVYKLFLRRKIRQDLKYTKIARLISQEEKLD